MNSRLQKQARGLLEEIEVGDWVVWSPDYEEPFSPQYPRPVEKFRMMGTGERRRKVLFAAPGFSDLSEATYDDVGQWRLATPQELHDHGIIDEIPDSEYPDDPHEPIHKEIGRLISATPVDQPRRHDFIDMAIDYLASPRPLPQRNWTLAQLVHRRLVYIVHSQNTDEGPMVHYRLTEKGREVVENLEGPSAH